MWVCPEHWCPGQLDPIPKQECFYGSQMGLQLPKQGGSIFVFLGATEAEGHLERIQNGKVSRVWLYAFWVWWNFCQHLGGLMDSYGWGQGANGSLAHWQSESERYGLGVMRLCLGNGPASFYGTGAEGEMFNAVCVCVFVQLTNLQSLRQKDQLEFGPRYLWSNAVCLKEESQSSSPIVFTDEEFGVLE